MEMNAEVLTLLDRWLYEETGEHLSDLQRIIIQEIWQGPRKTYGQIASEYNYSTGYIQQVVAPRLWQLLSRATGKKVTKSNLRSAVEPSLGDRLTATKDIPAPSLIQTIETPGESVPLGSLFYVERHPYEPKCYDELLKPGALLRIKGPRQMGKTSLMRRLIAKAREVRYRTVYLNFQQIERERISSLDSLLRWCCANIAHQLQIRPNLDEYWDEDIGSKVSCTIYLENYILEPSQTELVLVLEEIGELMVEPSTAQQFLTMLRSWYENGRSDEVWKKLRLVMVQSTEMYVHLNVNQSPFNVGFGINLEPFDLQQVSDLVTRHSLHASPAEVEQLHQLTGGHPYLVRLFLYHLVFRETDFSSLFATAATDEGIYHEHLHHHLWILQQFPMLKAVFKEVLASHGLTDIQQADQFQLQSLGLVTLEQNQTQVSCQLYQQYFGDRLMH